MNYMLINIFSEEGRDIIKKFMIFDYFRIRSKIYILCSIQLNCSEYDNICNSNIPLTVKSIRHRAS